MYAQYILLHIKWNRSNPCCKTAYTFMFHVYIYIKYKSIIVKKGVFILFLYAIKNQMIWAARIYHINLLSRNLENFCFLEVLPDTFSIVSHHLPLIFHLKVFWNFRENSLQFIYTDKYCVDLKSYLSGNTISRKFVFFSSIAWLLLQKAIKCGYIYLNFEQFQYVFIIILIYVLLLIYTPDRYIIGEKWLFNTETKFTVN